MPVAADRSMPWTTRPETPGDIPVIHAINAAAFETEAEADLVDALRRDPAWIDGLSWIVAAPDGTRIGHTLLTRCHVGDAPALCLAPVAVLPGRQGQGAGEAVIRAALAAARQMGERTVVVLGHPGYYPRFGFERASVHGIRLSVEVPDDALMALSLQDDARIPSGLVRYAPPFGI